MTPLDPSFLDDDTCRRLVQAVAEMIEDHLRDAGQITETGCRTRVDPGSHVVLVDSWWKRVIDRGIGSMSRVDYPDVGEASDQYIHGVPVRETDDAIRCPRIVDVEEARDRGIDG